MVVRYKKRGGTHSSRRLVQADIFSKDDRVGIDDEYVVMRAEHLLNERKLCPGHRQVTGQVRQLGLIRDKQVVAPDASVALLVAYGEVADIGLHEVIDNHGNGDFGLWAQ